MVALSFCLICSVPAGTIVTYLLYDSGLIDAKSWFYVLDGSIIAALLLFLGLYILGLKLVAKTGLTPGKTAKFIFLIIMALGLVWLINDPPRAGFRYDWSDLPFAAERQEPAYDILYTHFGPDHAVGDIDFSVVDFNKALKQPQEHEAEILALWEKSAPVREIITRLNSFNRIPDLSGAETALDIDLMPFISTLKVYRLYADLMMEKGHPEEAARPLAQLYVMIRKILPYSRFVIHKVVWGALAGRSLSIAVDLARHPSSDPETLTILKESFTPLTMDEISYEAAYISEYFFIKHRADQYDYSRAFGELVRPCPENPPAWNQFLFNLIGPVAFHRNRTLNVVTEKFNHLVAGTRTHPPDLSGARTIDHEIELRNIGGQMLLLSSFFDLTDYPDNMSKIKAQSDLLALYLHARLGENIDIKDYYSGKNYLETDEPGLFFSAGPDGLPETSDDIRL